MMSIWKNPELFSFWKMELASPFFLWLLLLIPALILLRYKTNWMQYATVKFSSLEYISKLDNPRFSWSEGFLFFLSMISLALFIISLAGPQIPDKQPLNSQGRDIMLVLDISESMNGLDDVSGYEVIRDVTGSQFVVDRQNTIKTRLDIAKEVVANFIKKRSSDRMGLIIFRNYPLTICPLTFSHDFLLTKLNEVDFSSIVGPGSTAIGESIVSVINAMDINSKAVSKLAILLTDGNNNVPPDPIEWAKVAAKKDIKIYTIGIGGQGKFFLFQGYNDKKQRVFQGIDEPLSLDSATLQEIANLTKGKFYLASVPEKLQEIYSEIDSQEQSELQVTDTKVEYILLYDLFLILAIGLLLIRFLLSMTVWRTLP